MEAISLRAIKIRYAGKGTFVKYLTRLVFKVMDTMPARTHGLSRTRIYNSWHAMMSRCYNVNDQSYNDYGGRGILVCKRWHDVEKFVEDMGPRPPRKTLDRINGNKGYYKRNCRWATKQQQTDNSIHPHRLEYKGKVFNATQLSKKLKIPVTTILLRRRQGKPLDKKITFKRRTEFEIIFG